MLTLNWDILSRYFQETNKLRQTSGRYVRKRPIKLEVICNELQRYIPQLENRMLFEMFSLSTNERLEN